MNITNFLRIEQREAIWYTLPAFATRALNFILLPIYSRVLLPADFGIVSVALVISGMLRLVLFPGIEGIYLRFGYQGYTGKKTKASADFGSIIRLHLLLVFICLPALTFPAIELSRRFSPDVPTHFILLGALSLGVGSFQAPFTAQLRASQRAGLLALFELASFLLNASGALLGLFLLKWGPVSLLLGECLSAVILCPLCIPIFFRSLRFPHLWTRDSFNRIGKGFLAIGPEAITLFAFTAADRYLLNFFRGPEQTGIYVAGYQFASMVVALATIGARQWKVILYRAYVDRTYPPAKIGLMYREAFILFLYLSAILSLLSRPLVFAFLGEKFREAQPLIPIVMIAAALRLPLSFFSMYSWAMLYRRLIVKMYLGSLVLFLFSLGILIPIYGAQGAAFSGVIAFLPFLAITQMKKFKDFNLAFDLRIVIAVGGLALSLSGWDRQGVYFGLAGVLIGLLLAQLRSYFRSLATLSVPEVEIRNAR